MEEYSSLKEIAEMFDNLKASQQIDMYIHILDEALSGNEPLEESIASIIIPMALTMNKVIELEENQKVTE